MKATQLQELEEMAADLHATACELPPGSERYNILQEIEKFRAQIISLQASNDARAPRAKSKEE